jgi:hypothetical protein
VSVLDRFKDGMGIEKMAIGLLSTAAHVGGGDAEAERVLRKLKDEYAHELAEKIRVIHQPIAGEGGTQWCQVCSQEEIQPQPVGWWVPWPCPTLAAIDPEVLNSE